MNNLNEQDNIPNPSQPVLPFTAEDLKREKARIRKELSRNSQSDEKKQAEVVATALRKREARGSQSDEKKQAELAANASRNAETRKNEHGE